ncbi:MinD/ParA family protein [Nocardia sp. NPDC058518]|uniref:MinD/ParA family ATP-binding protein n=1 Tax=Nocardia sp. NPDC058518 TaxID=3346534 RepID=UPI00364A16AA
MTLQIDLDAMNNDSAPDSTLHNPSPPGSPTDLVPLRGGAGRLLRPAFPPVVVMGAAGGAGATTTTLGLAAALASEAEPDDEIWPGAIDATLGGGDLALRGCDGHKATSSIQEWILADAPGLPNTIEEYAGFSSTGVAVMARTPDPLPRRESYVSVHRHLTDGGITPIYDGGAPVTNRALTPLLSDPRVGLVISVTARSDTLSRVSVPLRWLDQHFGEFVIGDAVLVLSHQSRDVNPHLAKQVRTVMGSWVRAIVEIPFDLHVHTGGPMSWHRLAPETRTAFLKLMGELR